MIVTKDKYLKEVGIVPTPDKWQINAAALDLRIGLKVYRPDTQTEIKIEIPAIKAIKILPGEHFLIQTLEKITLPNDMIAVVYPRSGTNRKGITVDMTGIVDPGYSGHLMIPVTNTMNVPVTFLIGERIAQIVFQRVEVEVEGRDSKYKDGPMGAKPDKQKEIDMLENGWLINRKLEGNAL